MDYKNLKEDIISSVNAYLGIRLTELLKPRCIDLLIQPITSTSLGIMGIFLRNGRSFTHTISLNVIESGNILMMCTDGLGLLKKILWCKEFRHLSEFFLFMETRFDSQLTEVYLNNAEKSA